MSSPLEEETKELGYSVVEVREGRQLRVVHRPCEGSDVCLFFVHGGGGRAGQFKHLIKAFESTYVLYMHLALAYTQWEGPKLIATRTNNDIIIICE